MRRAFVLAFVLIACGSTGSGDPPLPDDVPLVSPKHDEDASTAPDSSSTDGGTTPDDGGTTGAGDPCATATPTCPSDTATEGGGLVAIDRCAFALAQGASASDYAARIDALAKIAPPVTVDQVVTDTDRNASTSASVPGAPPGLAYAFKWNDEDETSTRWIPQGITGSADASPTAKVNGKTIVLVSFYDNGTGSYDKGARVAFVDVTTPSAPKYRFALLVEPIGTPAAPDIAPVKLHAGGMVWFGDKLYVVETTKGFRVFDLSKLMQVGTGTDAIGCSAGACTAGLYKYVVPQVDAFTTASVCTPKPIFSFVSLDRSTSPPSLLSGEYCSTTACTGPLAGRLFRWPLDPASSALASGKSWPSEVTLMGQKQVQGAASKDGVTYLSSSAPAGGGGALYRVTKGKSATSSWADSPEDLMIDATTSTVWSLSEGAGSRYVFAAALLSYPPP